MVRRSNEVKMVHESRLRNVFFRVKENSDKFNMDVSSEDLAYYAACLATGEDLQRKVTAEYRGTETHVEDIAAHFLQASEKEADELFYLGKWTDAAYRTYKRGNKLGALLITVNRFMVPKN